MVLNTEPSPSKSRDTRATLTPVSPARPVASRHPEIELGDLDSSSSHDSSEDGTDIDDVEEEDCE